MPVRKAVASRYEGEHIFVDTQEVTVKHDFGYKPQVWCENSGGTVFYGDVVHKWVNEFRVHFTSVKSGTVHYS